MGMGTVLMSKATTGTRRSITELRCEEREALGFAGLALVLMFVSAVSASGFYLYAMTNEKLVIGVGFEHVPFSAWLVPAITVAIFCLFAFLALFYVWLKRLHRVQMAARSAREAKEAMAAQLAGKVGLSSVYPQGTLTTPDVEFGRDLFNQKPLTGDQLFNPYKQEVREELPRRRPRRYDQPHEL